MRKKLTQKEYLNRIIEVHADRYDLSKVVYNGMTKHILIICRRCSREWHILPYKFLYQGCTCYKNEKLSKLMKAKIKANKAQKAVNQTNSKINEEKI